VASERIKSLVSNMFLPDEVDVSIAKKDHSNYDLEAYCRLEGGRIDKVFATRLLNLSDEVFKAFKNGLPREYLVLVDEVRSALMTDKVGARYAYMVRVYYSNELKLYYASSYGYYDRFNELTEHYKKIVESLNDVLWDSIKYVEYKAAEYLVEEVKNKIFSFYSRIPPKYLDVTVYDNEVFIYTAAQLIGRLIGKKGATINQLQQLISRRVKVYEAKYLTDLYSQEHPEVPKDPEVLRMVGEAIRLLGELEKKGVTVQQILKLKEEMISPDDYRVGEGETW
jgi:predicted RNA-binding protein YlqC (UPF0109 family)